VKRGGRTPELTGGGTYTDQVRKTTPPNAATVIERGERCKKNNGCIGEGEGSRIEGDGMAELTEKQLVGEGENGTGSNGVQAEEDKLEGQDY